MVALTRERGACLADDRPFSFPFPPREKHPDIYIAPITASLALQPVL